MDAKSVYGADGVAGNTGEWRPMVKCADSSYCVDVIFPGKLDDQLPAANASRRRLSLPLHSLHHCRGLMSFCTDDGSRLINDVLTQRGGTWNRCRFFK